MEQTMAHSAKVPSKYGSIILFINATESAHVPPVSFKNPPTVHVTSLANGSAGEEYVTTDARRPL